MQINNYKECYVGYKSRMSIFLVFFGINAEVDTSVMCSRVDLQGVSAVKLALPVQLSVFIVRGRERAAFTEIIRTFRRTVLWYDNENIIYVSAVELHDHHATFPKQI